MTDTNKLTELAVALVQDMNEKGYSPADVLTVAAVINSTIQTVITKRTCADEAQAEAILRQTLRI